MSSQKSGKHIVFFLSLMLIVGVTGALYVYASDANKASNVPIQEVRDAQDYKDDFVFDIDTNTITGYKGSEPDDGHLVIPAEIEIDGSTYKVEAIGDNAFSFETLGFSLKSVDFPDGLKTIGAHSFEGNCLKSFVIPSSLESIGDYAFATNQWEESESEFVVPEDSQLSSIGSHAFDTSNLGMVDLSNMPANSTVGDSAFEHNNISILTFGDNTFAEVGERAFASNNLSQVDTLNANTLGKGAFYDNGRYVVLDTTNVDNDVEMGHFGSVTKPTSIFVRGVLKDSTDMTVLSTTELSFNPSEELPYDQLLLKSKGTYTNTKVYAPGVSGCMADPKYKEVRLEGGNYSETSPLRFEYVPNEAEPIISELDLLQVKTGEVCDRAVLLNGVKALTADGTDITSSIKIDPESLDTSYAHTASVTYFVEDAFGNSKTVVRTVAIGLDPMKVESGNGWLAEDFTYSGSTITGLSSTGREKAKTNKKIFFPSINPYDGKPISSIGSKSSYGSVLPSNLNIQEVVIPEGITTLNYGCLSISSLQKVTLPSTLKHIDTRVFSYTKLSSVELPEGLEYIGVCAFENTPLQTIELPESLKTIADQAFRQSKLTSVKFNDGLKTLGKEAFSECKLTSIDLPHNLEEIGNGVFSNNQLTSITWPKEYANIPNYMFAYNKNLKEIHLSNTLKTIGKSAFSKCGLDMDVLEIPEGVVSIGDTAFNNWDNSNMNSGRYDYSSGDNKIKKLVLPASLKELGKGSFGYVPIEELEFKGNKLTEIKENTFNNARIEHIVLPEGIKTVEKNAFKECVRKGSFPQLPDSIETIGDNAFCARGSDTVPVDAVLPKNLTSIGDSAFSSYNLKSLTLNDKLKHIGDFAFSYGRLDSKLVIPANVTQIGDNCFSYTKIPELEVLGATTINCYAFNKCELTNVSLGDKVELRGPGIFEGNDLTEITIPSNTYELGADCFASNSISKVNIPASSHLQKIKNNAFGTNMISQVDLPTSIKEIANEAFNNNEGYNPFPNDAIWETDKSKVKLTIKDSEGNFVNPNNITDKENDTWYLNKTIVKVIRNQKGTKTPIGEPLFVEVPINGEKTITLKDTDYYTPVKSEVTLTGDGLDTKEVVVEYETNPKNDPSALSINLYHSKLKGSEEVADTDKVLSFVGDVSRRQTSSIIVEVDYSGDEQVIKDPWVVIDFNKPTAGGHIKELVVKEDEDVPFKSWHFEGGRAYFELKDDLRHGAKISINAMIKWDNAFHTPKGSIVDLTGQASIQNSEKQVIKRSTNKVGFRLDSADVEVKKENAIYAPKKGVVIVDPLEVDGKKIAPLDPAPEVPYQIKATSDRFLEKATFKDELVKYYAYIDGEYKWVYPQLVAEKSPGWELSADGSQVIYKDCEDVVVKKPSDVNRLSNPMSIINLPKLVLTYPGFAIDSSKNNWRTKKNNVEIPYKESSCVEKENVINARDENGRYRSNKEIEQLFLDGVLEQEKNKKVSSDAPYNIQGEVEKPKPEPIGNVDTRIFKRCWGEVGSHEDQLKNILLHNFSSSPAYVGDQDYSRTAKEKRHPLFDYHDYIYDAKSSREKEYEWGIAVNTFGCKDVENYQIKDSNLDKRLYYSAVYLPEQTVATVRFCKQSDSGSVDELHSVKLYGGRYDIPEDIAKEVDYILFDVEGFPKYLSNQKNWDKADVNSVGNIWSIQVYTKFRNPDVDAYNSQAGINAWQNSMGNRATVDYWAVDHQGNKWHESETTYEWVGLLPTDGSARFKKTLVGTEDNMLLNVSPDSKVEFDLGMNSLSMADDQGLDEFVLVDVLPSYVYPTQLTFTDEFVGAAKNPTYEFIENINGSGCWGVVVKADTASLSESCRIAKTPMLKGNLDVARVVCRTQKSIPNGESTNNAWVGWKNPKIVASGSAGPEAPSQLDGYTQVLHDNAKFRTSVSRAYTATQYIRPCDDNGVPLAQYPWSSRGIYLQSQQPYQYRMYFSHLKGSTPAYFETIEVLPYNQDKRIVKNEDGVYVDRYTDMTGITTDGEKYSALPYMTGPIKWDKPDQEKYFEYKYAVANPDTSYKGKNPLEICESVKWYTADEIEAMDGGFANVTAYKIAAKPDHLDELFDKYLDFNFDVPMKAPENKDFALDDKDAVSSFAYWINEPEAAKPVEVNNVWIHMLSKRAQLKIQKYKQDFGADAQKLPLRGAEFKLWRVVDKRDAASIANGSLQTKTITVGDKEYSVVAIPISPESDGLATEPGTTPDLDNAVDSVTTNSYGVALYKSLRCDWDYVLEEIKCPDGYTTGKEGPTRFIKGETLLKHVTDTSNTYEYEVVNHKIPEMVPIEPMSHSFGFYKVDKNGFGLTGVGFKLSATSVTGYEYTSYAYSSFGTGFVQFNGIPAFYGDVEFTLEEVSPVGTMTPVDKAKIHFKHNMEGDEWLTDSKYEVDEGGNIVAIEGFGRKDVQGKNYILPLKVKNDKTDIVLTKLGIYNVSEQEKALVDLNTNSGKLMPGVKLELREGIEPGSKLVAEAVTDGKGQIRFTGLDTETDYYVHEPEAPEGFKPLAEPIKVRVTSQGSLKINDVNTPNNYVVVPNIPEQNTNLLQLYKTDAQGGKGNPVEGARFELCEDSQVIQTATTDANGIVEFKDFGLDAAKKPIQKKFVIREAKVPGGYLSGFKPIEFETSAGEYQVFSYTAMNKPIQVQIAKISDFDNQPIPNVKFGIFKADGSPLVDKDGNKIEGITNQDGRLNFTAEACRLLDSTKIYTVKEIEVPEGYDKTRPCEFRLDLPGASNRESFNGVFEFTGVNHRLFADIKVVKTDLRTSSALAGAVFELYDSASLSDSLTEEHLIATNTSDGAGICSFTNLEKGKTYRLREVKAPSGYQKVPDRLVKVDEARTYYIGIADPRDEVYCDLHFQKFVNGDPQGFVQNDGAKKYFRFDLYDSLENGMKGSQILCSAESDDEGKINFLGKDLADVLRFDNEDMGKTRTYWVCEYVDSDIKDVIFDKRQVKVELTTTADEDGKLSVETIYTVYKDGEEQGQQAVGGETQVVFENGYVNQLPSTGVSTAFMLQGIALASLGVSCGIWFRKYYTKS